MVPFMIPDAVFLSTENITEVFGTGVQQVSGGRVCRDSRYFSVSLKLFQNKNNFFTKKPP